MNRLAGLDFVVPIAMEFITADLDLGQFLIGHLDHGWISSGIQLSVNGQTSRGGGRGDEVYDGLETAERLATPVLADVGEEAMLDLVPLAGAGRKVTNHDP